MQWKCFGGFSSFAWQSGILQLIAIHLITLHNILEYMQLAIIQTEAADLVKMNICVIVKTFGHDCRLFLIIALEAHDTYILKNGTSLHKHSSNYSS